MAKSRKYIKEDDDKKINAVIVDDGSMDNDTTTTDPGYCPGTGGSCPPPKPEWGTKEHRDMIKKTLNPTKKDKKQKKKRVRKFFLGGLMKAAKKGIKGAAKIGLLGGGAMAASHLFGKKNKGGGDAAEAEGVSSREGGMNEDGMAMMGMNPGVAKGGMGGLFGAVYGKMSQDKQARINKILAEK